MKARFNFDICIDELNLPPVENYNLAREISYHVRTGNFIKKYWGKFKNKITDDERRINGTMRSITTARNIGKRAVEVDFSMVKEEDNVFWFRPSECFANVVVPLFMLNGRQSSPNDRFQMIINSYHAAIIDLESQIIYDPTLDVIDALGANYSSEDKKMATIGLLATEEAIMLNPNGISIGTLSLSEYLNIYSSTKDGRYLREIFNDILGRDLIKSDSVGKDLSRLKK